MTFASQNNSSLPLAPTSASFLCLSHALCVDSEGNLLKNIVDKASLADVVYEPAYECVCVCVIGEEMNSISIVQMGCLFGVSEEDLLCISAAHKTWHKVEQYPHCIDCLAIVE